MIWAENIARMKKCRQIFLGKPKTKRPLGKLDLDRRIIFKWILEKNNRGGRYWLNRDQ
jgi:hypothetical protein